MSPRRRAAQRSLGALLAAVVLAVLASLLGPAASASTAGTTTPATGDDHASGTVRLGDDAVRSRTAADARASYAWRGSRLYYRETLPATWDWSLRTAVAKWNASGSRIKLVATSSRRLAQVTISYGDTGGAAGLATVGRTRGAFVQLSQGYAAADATSAHTRVEVMGVLAHELGHVLGFDHTATPCSLMGPVLDVAGCGTVAAEHPGAYSCRTIDAPLVSRLVRLYGGSARPAREGWCLIDPLPGTLAGVVVTAPATGELVVTWRRPTTVPSGAVVEVAHWDGDCTQQPLDATILIAQARDGRWVGDAASTGSCLTVGLVNRYGLASGRLATAVPQAALAAPAAPVAPVVEAPAVP